MFEKDTCQMQELLELPLKAEEKREESDTQGASTVSVIFYFL